MKIGNLTFIHIPKCAGTTIEKMFNQEYIIGTILTRMVDKGYSILGKIISIKNNGYHYTYDDYIFYDQSS